MLRWPTSHLGDLAKSLKKYGSLSCYLAASLVYELRGKIQMVQYGITQKIQINMQSYVEIIWCVFLQYLGSNVLKWKKKVEKSFFCRKKTPKNTVNNTSNNDIFFVLGFLQSLTLDLYAIKNIKTTEIGFFPLAKLLWYLSLRQNQQIRL